MAYEKTKDLANVAKMYGVAESTVYRLVAQKRKTGSLALKLSLVAFSFYGNLKHNSGAVEHMGDNLTDTG